jgi:hypothetical protein
MLDNTACFLSQTLQNCRRTEIRVYLILFYNFELKYVFLISYTFNTKIQTKRHHLLCDMTLTNLCLIAHYVNDKG